MDKRFGAFTGTDPISRAGRLLAQAAQLIGEALRIDPHTEPDAALLEIPALAQRVIRCAEALNATVLPVIETGGLWALDGQRSFAAWTATKTGTSYSHARREVQRARTLRDHLPATAKAWR